MHTTHCQSSHCQFSASNAVVGFGLSARLRLLAVVGLLLVALSACVPATQGLSNAAQETERLAVLAWHRMQIGFLELGSYSTDVLRDLELPQGVQWTLEDFSRSNYRIEFRSSQVDSMVWLVTPQGVRREARIVGS